jgi:hypothetical protein
MAMIDIHHNGWTKPIYDKDMRALIQQTMFMSFKERFDGVHELLMVRSVLLHLFTFNLRNRSTRSAHARISSRENVFTQ